MDIYVVVREDLSSGLKCAQACHAVAGLVDYWRDVLPTDIRQAVEGGRMIVLEVPKEQITRCSYPKIPTYAFHEPDLNNELTAIAYAVNEFQTEAFKNLCLAFPRKKKWWRF